MQIKLGNDEGGGKSSREGYLHSRREKFRNYVQGSDKSCVVIFQIVSSWKESSRSCTSDGRASRMVIETTFILYWTPALTID